MSDRRIHLALASASLAVLVTASAVHAQAASPTPTADAAEADGAPTAVREGWTLVAGENPPFSIELPPEWSQTDDDGLVGATSTAGESLLLTVDEPPDETEFDAYVTRVERALEKRLKRAVPTVFRRTGSGLVARLDQAPGKRRAGSEHTALFLFPTCDDGARTLSISGMPPGAALDAAPDAWDRIATAVNPCSAEQAAELVLTPEEATLAAAYHELATEVNDKREPIVARLEKGGAVADWTKAAGRFGRLYGEYAPRMEALPWTPDTAPLGATLATAYRDAADLFIGLSKLRNAKAINARLGQSDPVLEAISSAGRAIRLALGLPTVPR